MPCHNTSGRGVEVPTATPKVDGAAAKASRRFVSLMMVQGRQIRLIPYLCRQSTQIKCRAAERQSPTVLMKREHELGSKRYIPTEQSVSTNNLHGYTGRASGFALVQLVHGDVTTSSESSFGRRAFFESQRTWNPLPSGNCYVNTATTPIHLVATRYMT